MPNYSIAIANIDAESPTVEVLSRLREAVTSAAYLPGSHSLVYRRQMLAGLRAMPFTYLFRVAEMIFRSISKRRGADAARAFLVYAFTPFFRPFGLRLVVDRPARAHKAAREELHDVYAAAADLGAATNKALEDGVICHVERAKIRPLAERLKAEIDDLAEVEK